MSFEETLAALLARQLEPLRAEISQLRAKLDERASERPTGHLVTVANAAQNLAISKRHLQALITQGVVPVVKLGERAVRLDLAAVRAALEANSHASGPTDAEIVAAAQRAASPGKQP